jgi:hypothetical protein
MCQTLMQDETLQTHCYRFVLYTLLAFRCFFPVFFFQSFFPVNLYFIFAALFLSAVRWGRQALLQVLVLALAGVTCKCA